MNKYARNHRPAKFHLFRSQMLTASEIATALGTDVSTVSKRLKNGTPLDIPVREMHPRVRPERAIAMPKDEVINGLLCRAKDPEAHETAETLLVAAYNAGMAAGAAEAARGERCND